VWVLVAVAACFGIFFYVHTEHTVVEVSAAKVEYHTLAQRKSTNGRVAPLDDFEAHAPLAGVVGNIYVKLGEKVQSGQELVRMDDSEARKDLAAAQASLDSSEALLQAMEHGGTQDERLTENANLSTVQTQVAHDRASLTALEKLQTEGSASANEVAQAQHQLDAAQAQVAQLQTRQSERYSSDDLRAQKAQVTEAQAAVDAAKAIYAGVDIHAPFAGTVYAVPVTQYQFAPAGETLLQVADLTKLQIKAYFDEPEIGQLKTGQPVTIVWPAKPGAVWHGHITQAPTTITTYGNTRNVGECLISVDDADGILLPNTNVTVTVTELQHDNVLSLPREALRTEGMNDYVYRIVGDHLVKTPVQVGLTNNERFEIKSGLNQGDLVALGATTEAELSDGLRVKVHP
jgi:HlyD family secretion protein